VTTNRYAPPGAEVADPSFPSLVVPSAVVRACQMFIASLLLGLIASVPGVAGSSQEWAWGSLVAACVLVALVGGISVWLTVKIYRGRNWARWVMLVYLAVSWVATFMEFSEGFNRSPVVASVELLTTVIEVVACGLLFFGSGARWFATAAAARKAVHGAA
jgi:hypothetical protein